MEELHPGPYSTEDAFERLFKSHFARLHAYACTLLRESHQAEEMVQNVFVKLYEKGDGIRIDTSLEAYLYRSVYYECLNHQKHLKVRRAYLAHAARQGEPVAAGAGSMGSHARELETRLHTAMNALPEQCRTIFQLSRFESLKYREIADRLGISVKTVENQMGKALRILRERLADFLPLFLFTLLNTIAHVVCAAS
jgi:RNA polymerase sigma-70 factor (ECF subfamily)